MRPQRAQKDEVRSVLEHTIEGEGYGEGTFESKTAHGNVNFCNMLPNPFLKRHRTDWRHI